eukprot:scaffold17460_cov128-Isochrysis_galbana.AAC.15
MARTVAVSRFSSKSSPAFSTVTNKHKQTGKEQCQKDALFKRQRWPTRLACLARQEHPDCRTASNEHTISGLFSHWVRSPSYPPSPASDGDDG